MTDYAKVIDLRPGQPRRRGALEVRCPWPPCQAAAGSACTGPDGRALTVHTVHPSRADAATALELVPE